MGLTIKPEVLIKTISKALDIPPESVTLGMQVRTSKLLNIYTQGGTFQVTVEGVYDLIKSSRRAILGELKGQDQERGK